MVHGHNKKMGKKIKDIFVNIYNKTVYSFYNIEKYSLSRGAIKENKKLLKILEKFEVKKTANILDVGCGYGRTLALLKEAGYSPVGVDANPKIVEQNIKKNLTCCTSEDFFKLNNNYDVIIFNHVVEHLSPKDLLDFMNNYLSKLSNNGILIISSPINSKQFYIDFDHIKPYLPLSFDEIFNPDFQVQYSCNRSMKRIFLSYIRTPYTNRNISLRSQTWKMFPIALLNVFLIFLSIISFGIIRKTMTWMAVYK